MGIWAISCTLFILLPFDDGVEEGGPQTSGFHPPTMELLKQELCGRMGTVGNLLVPGGNSALTMRAGEEGALSFWPHKSQNRSSFTRSRSGWACNEWVVAQTDRLVHCLTEIHISLN